MTRMTTVSARSPISPETTAAASSTRIMKSRNWASTRCHTERGGASGRRLAPKRCWRALTSSAARPSSTCTRKRCATSADGCVCGCSTAVCMRWIIGAHSPRTGMGQAWCSTIAYAPDQDPATAGPGAALLAVNGDLDLRDSLAPHGAAMVGFLRGALA